MAANGAAPAPRAAGRLEAYPLVVRRRGGAGGLGQEIVDSLLDQSFSILGQTIAGVMGGAAAGLPE